MIISVGTGMQDKGGIAAVINSYVAEGLYDRYDIQHIQTHSTKSQLHKLLLFIKAYAILIKTLLTRNVELIHCHVSYGASFHRKALIILLAKLFRVPILFQLHSGGFEKFFNNSSVRMKQYIRFIVNCSDHVLVLSSKRKAWMDNEILTYKTSQVLFNFISPVPAKVMPGQSDSKTVLFLGKLIKDKGIYDLLRSFKTMIEKVPNAQLKIGGDGPILQLKEMCRQLGIEEQVEFLGWVSGREKDEYMKNAAVFVLPSYFEAFPISVLEAMSAGTPIVTSGVGGIKDAVQHLKSALLIKPGDVTGISNSLVQLLTDEALCSKLATQAQNDYQNKFTASVIIPQLEGIYQKALREGRRKTAVKKQKAS